MRALRIGLVPRGDALKMSGTVRPLRPGDAFRVDASFPRSRLDEDRIDFLRVHYETNSPGLARVVEILDDGMVFDLWGHRFRTPVRAEQVPPLSPLARLLAPEQLGEALLRHEVKAGKVATDEVRRPSRQPLVRLWLRKTRGPLPVLEALGGRIRLPILRKAKSRLRFWLGTLGVMPPAIGFLDHGMLVDRISVDIDLSYSSSDRLFRLDRILLHKNHSIHLIGIDLNAKEQRTFRLDKVWSMSLPGLGKIEKNDLYWELQSLCMSREEWLWYWNRHQERHARPPGPPIGAVGRTVSMLGKRTTKTIKKAKTIAPALRKTWSRAKGQWIVAKAAVRRAVRRATLRAILEGRGASAPCPLKKAEAMTPLPDEAPIEVRFAATKSLWFDMVFIAGQQGRLVEVADTMWDAGQLLQWVRAIVAGRPAVMECDREGVIDEVRSEPVDEDRVRLTISAWQESDVYLDAVVGRRKLVWEVYWELANIDRLLDCGYGDYVRGWWRLPDVEKWLDWERTGRSLTLYDPVAKQSRLGNGGE